MADTTASATTSPPDPHAAARRLVTPQRLREFFAPRSVAEERMTWLAQRIASSPVPVIPVASTCNDLGPYARQLLAGRGMTILGGLHLGINALGNALRWVENRGHVLAAGDTAGETPAVEIAGPWSEHQARELLTEAGVPVVPGGLAGSADQATEIARRVGLPVALKICSAQVAHKSDIGGVALGLNTEAEVRAAYEKVRAPEMPSRTPPSTACSSRRCARAARNCSWA